jgi:hypothetical protein
MRIGTSLSLNDSLTTYLELFLFKTETAIVPLSKDQIYSTASLCLCHRNVVFSTL